jgi:hypothetical protein
MHFKCHDDSSGSLVLLSGLSAGDAEFLHFGDQRRALQPKSRGRAFRPSDDPVGVGQGAEIADEIGVLE